MHLIVGLGNPGREYEQTRHNAGWMALDRLAARLGLSGGGGRSQFHSAALDAVVAGQRCLLLKPTTYMNRSGLAVGEAATFYKLEPSQVMVVVDETALPAGAIRLRASGSPGGHNGLADVERALGTRDYPRLRIGVDAPPGRQPQKDYVLARFTEPQWAEVDPALDRACDAIECWLTDGIDKAMSVYNATG